MLQEKIVRSIINLIPNGQLFVVHIQKKDGTERTLTCQKGVKKHVKNLDAPSESKKPKHLVTVWTPDGYRSFDVSRVYEIRALGAVVSGA